MAGIRIVGFEELSRQLEKRLGRLVGRRSTWCCPLTDLIECVYISSKKNSTEVICRHWCI
jgi:hypothetical protein